MISDEIARLADRIKEAAKLAYWQGFTAGAEAALIVALVFVLLYWLFKADMKHARVTILVALLGCLLWAAGRDASLDNAPVPVPPPASPEPKKPQPRRPVRPKAGGVGSVTIGGETAPDGKTEVACDLPASQRIKNIGSRLDGAGMCVFSSIEMDARWANLEAWRGWRDWCAAHFPGGGYPEKVDRLLDAYAKSKNLAVPDYVQVENGDPAVLELAVRTGRMVGVTYNGHDPHYAGSIAHMVCLVHYDPKSDLAAILDNNFPNVIAWMPVKDFLQRWRGSGGGWAFVFLSPGPPPVPHN